jgi:peptide/nickel transport system ATP-binding protein
MKIFDIVKEPLDVHKKGLKKIDIKEYVFSALKKVNLNPDDIISKFPHMLSGGQRQRVSFARALVLKPRLIIADEPVSMLDVSIRGQILELMKKLKQEENISFLYITHDLATSQYVGDNIVILYKGQIIEQGNIKQVLYKPLHPYTRALIAAIPKFTKDQAHHEIKIKNDPESIFNQGGCKFINKCLYSTEKCKNNEPLLTKEGKTHSPSSSSSSPSSTPHDPHNSHFIRCFNYESIS